MTDEKMTTVIDLSEPHHRPPPLTLMRPGERIRVRYKNWRGETAIRNLELDGVVHWGKTEWHPEFQWLIAATDLDRCESRVFALKDMEPA